ncbi:unnamed protein product [Mytilus coruscus]|uniref:Uncharacterized protein n=1 Tax=Mytilus coruscus TaxID=42192 RepID=A0A6J8C4W9_MYTCO|nr:unnamed protein product [Mytilus coruscus]
MLKLKKTSYSHKLAKERKGKKSMEKQKSNFKEQQIHQVNIHGKSLNKEQNTVRKLLPGESSIPQTIDTKHDKIDTVSSLIQDSDVFSTALDTQVCQRRQFLKRRQVDSFLQVQQKCLKITAASTHGPQISQIDSVGVIRYTAWRESRSPQQKAHHKEKDRLRKTNMIKTLSPNEKLQLINKNTQCQSSVRENKDDIFKLAERSKDKKRKLEKKKRLSLQELLVIRKKNAHIQSILRQKKDDVTKSIDKLKDRKQTRPAEIHTDC